jgi:ABC-type antimicrobial peptide transport system permease subunit
MAVGAQAGAVVRLVTVEAFMMVFLGAVAGLALGVASARYMQALFFQVKASDLGLLAFPSLAILGVALLAALRPVLHAVRIDPASMLRTE